MGSKGADFQQPPKDKTAVDSQEVNFSKLQGKTYPSLVVFVRPTLLPRDKMPNDRPALDAKVKSVLMMVPAKFTEWLIQQGLVRSEMDCHLHPNNPLKLGVYSEVNRFPYSGGYVWISECCKQKFVSVYNGSIFEMSTQTPSVLLKLIYHWSCQTNVQNVVQWVKIDNFFIKQFYTQLRGICTVALYNHFGLLGGRGKSIEVGVISLGTSTADGAQRQVKVEVLGIYDPSTKMIRLRAVEPLPYTDKVYRKRFLKILEPLVDWVHEDSTILTDITVDKTTLLNYGFRNVQQVNPAERTSGSNTTIMDYLRRVVPRMFQNTLSLLNRSMIQQFLDELVWRELYGNTPNDCFKNMLNHIAEQTKINQKDRLVARLVKVTSNPFKNWKHAAAVPRGNPVPAAAPPPAVAAPLPQRRAAAVAAAAVTAPLAKRKRSPPPPQQRAAHKPPQPVRQPSQTVIVSKRPRQEAVETVSLEGYYYGIHVPRESDAKKDCCEDLVFEAKCPECELTFVTNTELQDHLFDHVVPTAGQTQKKYQCRYCFERYRDHDHLMKHIMDAHSIEVVRGITCYDLICEVKFTNVQKLAAHMLRAHYPSELPYRCGCCKFACSSRRMTLDHFYEEHAKSATLMCPMCLQIFVCANRVDGTLAQNVNAFLLHLKEHRSAKKTRACSRCSLQFMCMGKLRAHLLLDHGSGFAHTNQLQPISKSTTSILKPTTKLPPSRLSTIVRVVESAEKLTLDVPNGRMCLECGQDFDQNNHVMGLLQCLTCSMQTYCLPSLLNHTDKCVISMAPAKNLLDREYHCVCEFSSKDATALIRHMTMCERKSVYVSAEEAQLNVKVDGVLDGLGLIKNSEEGVVTGQQETDGTQAVVEETTEMEVTPELVEQEGSMMEQIEDNTDGFMSPDGYNPNLSLADLAPATPSVIVQHMPDVQDYQDLQTPQPHDVHQLMGYDGGDVGVQEQSGVHGGDMVFGQGDPENFQGY